MSYDKRFEYRTAALESVDKAIAELHEFWANGDRSVNTFKLWNKRGTKYRVISAPCDEYKAALRNYLRILKEAVRYSVPAGTRAGRMPGRVHFARAVRKEHAHLHQPLNYFLCMDIKRAFDYVSIGQAYRAIQLYSLDEYRETLLEFLPLCFIGNRMPQGFPTSPLLFDMLMWAVDHKLRKTLRYAKRESRSRSEVCTVKSTAMHHEGIMYYRYVDDIIVMVPAPYVDVITSLIRRTEFALRSAGFRINRKKTRVCRAFPKYLAPALEQERKPRLPDITPVKIVSQAHILGYVQAGSKTGFRAGKKQRKRLRALEHIWDKFPHERTESLKAQINGLRGAVRIPRSYRRQTPLIVTQ